MADIEVCDDLAADRRQEVIDLVGRVTLRLGYRPLSDHLWLDLMHGTRPRIGAVLVHGSGRLVGYAQLSPSAGGWVAGAVVDDIGAAHDRLDRTLDRTLDHTLDRVLDILLDGILDLASRRGGGDVHWWVMGDDSPADAVALAAGMTAERAVHQMVVELPLPTEHRSRADVAVRAFRVGLDESEWLAVNNAAFAGHGEQGGWDAAILAQRERESWFDPEGFLLHERDGRLAAFCWTKLHHDVEPVTGEIYVIAVHPDFHGLGLGRALTVAGLESIARRGVRRGMLFVDTGNVAAIGLYRSLGFTVERTDHAFILSVPAIVAASTKDDAS